MKWFDDLDVLKKILLAVGVLVVALVGVGWMGNRSADQINLRLNQLAERDFTGAVDAMKAENTALEIRVVARGIFLVTDPAEQERMLRKIDELDQQLGQRLDAIEKLLVSDELRGRLADTKRDRATWMAQIREAGRLQIAKDPGALAALGKAIPTGDRIRETLGKIVASKEGLARAAATETDVIYAHNRNLLFATILAAAAFGAAVAFLTGRAISRPLGQAVQSLARVADGDYTQRVDVRSDDEIGKLGTALNKAVESVGEALREVRGVAEGVATAAQQLTGAAAQISSGAQEQASSLEETAASLEEVSATVRQNADGAQHAVQLATASREVAEKGGEVVGAAVSAMNEITQASKRIADIITTIDEIAFQTNILALNAAVEAARAGEQGRGFAVVAAEVRDLAQRSAGAAKEIKGLIHDAGEKVETGSHHVLGSGETLREIVTSVKRVTDMIAEIAAASREQSTGIEQVNKAVTQMDQVTQSNAAQTEELSATAQTLEAQSEQLRVLVARFQLEGGARTLAAAAAEPKAPRVVAAKPPRPKPHGRANGRANGKPATAPVAFEEF